MHNVTSVAAILQGELSLNQEVVVVGWVRTRRDSKAGISFIGLHDGSCFKPLQVVAPNTLANYNDILRLSAGAAIVVTGKLVASPAEGQALELHAAKIEITGLVDDPETYPITPKYHTLEYLREHPDLRIRTNTIGAAMRVANTLSFAIHQFFYKKGFVWVRTPLITGSDCEGAGQMFRVSTLDLMNLPKQPDGKIDFSEDFFGRETFLTVSGQLNLETYCMALAKVYTFGPAFRAENSNTARHLAELWMIEPEIAFADLLDNAKLAEELLKYVAKMVLDDRSDDLAFFAERIDKEAIMRLENLLKSGFRHMEYREAIAILQKANKKFEFPVAFGVDLQSEHERYLAEEYVKGPLVLMNYPKQIKSFYMRMNEDNETVAAMDILVPGIGEIVGGSQREERYDVLVARMRELKMDLTPYEWYLNLRRYGTAKHAGFGLGFERLINYVTGLTNIRDVIPFPRTPKHADF